MHMLKKFFLSRKLALFLLVAILASVLVASLVPQTFITPASEMQNWRADNGWLVSIADACGLNHVYTAPWFAVLIALALVSLSLSSMEQFRAALRKTFKAAPLPESGGNRIRAAEREISATMRRHGYLLLSRTAPWRFVKNPWGYWGNFLLHAGIVATIAASLLVALTQQRGAIMLVEGVLHQSGEPWESEEHGLLTERLSLPYSVRLDQLKLAFRKDNHVDQVASEITLLPENGGDARRLTAAINANLTYQGKRIYQSNEYGDAFTLEFTSADGGKYREKLLLLHPAGLDKASYGDFDFPWLKYKLSTKYYADADKKLITSPDRLLVMRIMENNRELGRISLKNGESGRLGNYLVRLTAVEKWSKLIFVHVPGMPLVFIGFTMIVLGIMLNFFTPPREFIVARDGDGFVVSWRAEKFADFYADEHGDILKNIETEQA